MKSAHFLVPLLDLPGPAYRALVWALQIEVCQNDIASSLCRSCKVVEAGKSLKFSTLDGSEAGGLEKSWSQLGENNQWFFNSDLTFLSPSKTHWFRWLFQSGPSIYSPSDHTEDPFTNFFYCGQYAYCPLSRSEFLDMIFKHGISN